MSFWFVVSVLVALLNKPQEQNVLYERVFRSTDRYNGRIFKVRKTFKEGTKEVVGRIF